MTPVDTCRKVKRPSQRFAKKERNNDAQKKDHLRGIHDAVRSALAHAPSRGSLCTTPESFIDMLRHMYDTEFPEHANRLQIELVPLQEAREGRVTQSVCLI